MIVEVARSARDEALRDAVKRRLETFFTNVVDKQADAGVKLRGSLRALRAAYQEAAAAIEEEMK